MNVGCCGRPVSIAGLAELADMYPPTSPQGRRARARLAYTIVAAKAARAGDRRMYARAMHGLSGLGDLDLPTLLTQAGVSPAQFDSALATARPYMNALLALASAGDAIAAQIPGADQTVVNVINMVIGWIRGILNSTPTNPFHFTLSGVTLDPNTLHGFTQFCVWRGTITTAINVAMSTAMLAASSDANAQQALTLIGSVLTGIVDGICNVPQIAAATANVQAAGTCADGGAIGPHWVVVATGTTADGRPSQQCACEPGYTAMPDHTCQPVAVGSPCPQNGPNWVVNSVSPFGCRCADGYRFQANAGDPNHGTCQPMVRDIIRGDLPVIMQQRPLQGRYCPDGSIAPGGNAALCGRTASGGGAASSGPSAAAVVGIPAAAFLAWKLFF
jgi:hypothetical protein